MLVERWRMGMVRGRRVLGDEKGFAIIFEDIDDIYRMRGY